MSPLSTWRPPRLVCQSPRHEIGALHHSKQIPPSNVNRGIRYGTNEAIFTFGDRVMVHYCSTVSRHTVAPLWFTMSVFLTSEEHFFSPVILLRINSCLRINGRLPPRLKSLRRGIYSQQNNSSFDSPHNTCELYRTESVTKSVLRKFKEKVRSPEGDMEEKTTTLHSSFSST